MNPLIWEPRKGCNNLHLNSTLFSRGWHWWKCAHIVNDVYDVQSILSGGLAFVLWARSDSCRMYGAVARLFCVVLLETFMHGRELRNWYTALPHLLGRASWRPGLTHHGNGLRYFVVWPEKRKPLRDLVNLLIKEPRKGWNNLHLIQRPVWSCCLLLRIMHGEIRPLVTDLPNEFEYASINKESEGNKHVEWPWEH